MIVYAKKLQEQGARNVLVSMAGDGAVLIAETSHDYKTAFKMGISSGSASAFSENLATREEVDAIFNTLTF